MKTQIEQTKEVAKWWNNNPFTLGLAKNGDLVGRIDFSQINITYFKEIERKFRKFTDGACQEIGEPLLSSLINYKYLKNKNVLDIAIGTGFSLVTFAEQGAKVVGIDITKFAVKQSKKNLEYRNLNGDIIRMDAQNLGFRNLSFNFVNAWGCLMHMPNTQEAINEIYRVLKPKGRFLVYMYNKNSWPFWFNIFFLRGILFGKIINYKFNINKLTSRYTDGATIGGNPLAKFYTPKEAAKMFKKAGFIKIKAYPLRIPHEPNSWPMRKFPIFKYLPDFLKYYLTKFARGLIIEGEKATNENEYL